MTSWRREWWRRPVRRVRQLVGDRRGAVMVEFALTAPLLLLLVAGILELGRFMFTQSSLQAATATALRHATIDTTLDEAAIRRILLDNLPELDPRNLEGVSLERIVATGGDHRQITIRAVFTFRPVVAAVLMGPLRIEAAMQGVAAL